MAISKETSEAIAELYLKPLLELVDGALQNPVFLKTAEETLESMKNNLSTSRAVSGILLEMDEVDLRGFQVETFEVAIKLLKVRDKQQRKTVELKGKQISGQNGLDQFRKSMAY